MSGMRNSSLDTHLSSVWSSKHVPSSAKFIVLVFEDDNSTFDINGSNMTMGMQIKMDLLPYRKDIKVTALPASSPLASLLNVTSYPHMAMFSRNDSSSPLYSGEATHNATKELVHQAEMDPVGSQREDPHREENWRNGSMINCKKDPERCKKLYYVSETDMLKAARMALYNEVLLNKDEIAGADFDHLRDFLQLLIDYFPTGTKMNAPRPSSKLVFPPFRSIL